MSEVISDEKLIFNGIVSKGNVKISFYELTEQEIYNLNSVIYADGKNILFSNEKALNDSKYTNYKREIIIA